MSAHRSSPVSGTTRARHAVLRARRHVVTRALTPQPRDHDGRVRTAAASMAIAALGTLAALSLFGTGPGDDSPAPAPTAYGLASETGGR